ncbi:MAG: ribonuclease P protein component, partial [Nitrospina sp.]|nr:ribonuclease P protein component [Nitrospina sp.]
RNLAKRKIREVFRNIKGQIEPAMDIVIVSGRNLISLPVSAIERKIFQSLPFKM